MVLHRKILIVVGAFLAAVVMISACSSSSSSSPAAAGSTASASGSQSAAAAAAGSPITIGVECSCSGPFGANQAVGYTLLEAWQKSVNAAGGLNGHPVQLIEKNNDSNPSTALTDAQALVADKVTVIFDLDILDMLWEKVAAAAKIPVIGGNFSSPEYYTDSDYFPSGQTNDSITYSVAAVAKQAGATSLADFYCAESAQCQESVPLIKAAGQSVGVPVVYSASISATAPNYTAQCVAAKQAGVKAIFIGDSIAVIDRVATDCNQQGYDPVYVTEGTGFQNMALTTPGLENHLWSSYPILPYFGTESAVSSMYATLDKYYPGTQQQTLTWSEFAPQVWTGALLLAQAVKNAGVTSSDTVSAAMVTAGLNKVSGDTLGGFSPPLTFTGGKHTVDCWYTGRVLTGKAVQVGGLSCEKS
jgi:branched-chain amino acid transport system substrate-binding protein